MGRYFKKDKRSQKEEVWKTFEMRKLLCEKKNKDNSLIRKYKQYQLYQIWKR